MVRFMSSLRGAIAFAAGVTAATTMAYAQPIVSPREVTDPMPAEQAPPAELPAVKSSLTKAAPTKTKAASTRAGKATKTAKSSKPAKSTKVAKSTHSAKSSKPARSSQTKHPSKSSKPSSKPSKPASSSAMPSHASVRAGLTNGARGDNLPRGFTWPATPEMHAAGQACEAELTALGVTWKPSTPEGRIVDPVEVPDGVIGGIQYTSKWRSPPHKLDCQLARALAQIGPVLHAAGVREVRWGSIYRWSNVRTHGQTLPFLSRHALGLAMDIVEFVDDAGRVANVQQDYLKGDALLQSVEQAVNDSGKFRLVLTPKNDPKSHDDHFHVEANPDYAAP
jgi:hypothetical protein